MKENKVMSSGLVECLLANSIDREKLKLLKLCDVINWESLRGYLKGIHKNDIDSQGGQKAYDHVSMLKALILGQWHSLSDEELERSLQLRVDFMLFTGFKLGEMPDATTICRFRNKLIEKKKYKTILKKINQQLKSNNYQVEFAETAVVDATIIESQAQSEQVVNIPEDRKEEESDDDETMEEYLSLALKIQMPNGSKKERKVTMVTKHLPSVTKMAMSLKQR